MTRDETIAAAVAEAHDLIVQAHKIMAEGDPADYEEDE